MQAAQYANASPFLPNPVNSGNEERKLSSPPSNMHESAQKKQSMILNFDQNP